eukprot:170275-Pyramimonas_sp.AAC.1
MESFGGSRIMRVPSLIVEKGVVRLCRYAKERVIPFCVKRKDRCRRQTVVARRASRRFHDPPSVILATCGSFCELEVSDDLAVHASSTDVQDSFCRFRIDEELIRYLGLLAIRARGAGLAG